MVHEVQQGRAQQGLEQFIGHGIVHFSGFVKPWMQWSDSWLAQLWSFYARPVWPADEPLTLSPSTIEHLRHWAAVLELEGKLQQACQVRGRIDAVLSAHLDALGDRMRGLAATG